MNEYSFVKAYTKLVMLVSIERQKRGISEMKMAERTGFSRQMIKTFENVSSANLHLLDAYLEELEDIKVSIKIEKL